MRNPYDEILLLEYVEGELDAAGQAKVQAWMRADPRLERLVMQMIADRQTLRRMPDPPAPAWIMDEVERRLEREMLMEETGSYRSLRAVEQGHRLRLWAVRLAAAALLAVATGLVVWSLVPQESKETEVSVATAPPIAATPEPTPNAETPRPRPPESEPVTVAETPEPAPEPAPEPEPEPPATPPRIAITLPWKVDLGQVLAAPDLTVTERDDTTDPPAASDPPGARVFARIGQPMREGELRFPGNDENDEKEVATDESLRRLADDLARRPTLAARCRIEILTRDPDATRTTLKKLSGHASGNKDAPLLRVVPSDLPRAVSQLKASADHLMVKVFRDGRLPAATTPGQADLTRSLIDSLPLEGAPSTPEPVAIRVVIRGP